MSKILVVARREFIETVKTRAFFFGVILMPALIIGIVFLSARLTESGKSAQTPLRRIAMLDQHGKVFAAFAEQIRNNNTANPQQPYEALNAASDSEDALRARVASREIYAYVIVPPDAVSGSAVCRMGRSDGQLVAGRTISNFVSEAIINTRFAANDPPLDRGKVFYLQREVSVANIDLATGQVIPDDTEARILTPFIFIFLLYMATFGISMGLLTSVLEEKNTRVVEMLLAALSPTQLMAGKILGISAVGVVVLTTWMGVGWFTARSQNMLHLITGTRLTFVVLYFFPGFLLMASVMAGIGSACNTIKEAQSMSSPLTMLNMLPMMLWFYLSQFPHTALSVILSFIPPITPVVMVLRVCADPDIPLWQVIGTLLLMWLSVGAAIWAAGKIFRIGVLMYGKPPSVRELLKWVRYT